MISLRNVSAGYEGRVQLRNATFDVGDKGLVGITGPNGGGKTTLLRVMLGLLRPMSGQVEYRREANNNVGGDRVSTLVGAPYMEPAHYGRERVKRLRMGYLPQYSSIDRAFPISVRDVVRMGALKHLSAVDECMHLTGIEHLADRPIRALSGGEMQRVLLARALAGEPEVLVLDEPDTYIDKGFSTLMYGLIQRMSQERAVVVVSHDIDFQGMGASLILNVAESVSVIYDAPLCSS